MYIHCGDDDTHAPVSVISLSKVVYKTCFMQGRLTNKLQRITGGTGLNTTSTIMQPNIDQARYTERRLDRNIYNVNRGFSP